MKQYKNLFSCKVIEANRPFVCTRSKQHPILIGQLHFRSSRSMGYASPFCLACGREMVLAAHNQLDELMQDFNRQATAQVAGERAPKVNDKKQSMKGPRKLFKAEVKRMRKSIVCYTSEDHVIPPAGLHFHFETHRGTPLDLCYVCGQATVALAHKQLDELIQVLGQ